MEIANLSHLVEQGLEKVVSSLPSGAGLSVNQEPRFFAYYLSNDKHDHYTYMLNILLKLLIDVR